MTDPVQLEENAQRLRTLARHARDSAAALSSHLHDPVASAQDDTLWRGSYPAAATAELSDCAHELVDAAELLGDDAAAWERHARRLDSLAEAARAEQRSAEGRHTDTSGGAR